jgi:hypothetical protein
MVIDEDMLVLDVVACAQVMEQRSNDLIVIFAGYKDRMDQFFSYIPGTLPHPPPQTLPQLLSSLYTPHVHGSESPYAPVYLWCSLLSLISYRHAVACEPARGLP